MSISVTQKFVSQKKAVFIRVLTKNEKLRKAEKYKFVTQKHTKQSALFVGAHKLPES